MAILDTEKNQIVIRLVYDGTPLSGKTVSLKALAGSLSKELYTPEELYGRTTYFDWVEYTGGLFEGYQLRCQIVSVPGQLVWATRRQHLVESADVIVFVGDTTRPRFDESLTYLRGLTEHLQTLEGPPIGIVFQANKRDLDDAVRLEEIEQRLGDSLRGVAVVESVATEATGIRHAFVLAVRLCLDRVRELLRTDSLRRGKPDIESGAELLRSIKDSEQSASLSGSVLTVSHPRLQTHLANDVLSEVLTGERQTDFASEAVAENQAGKGNATTTGIAAPDVRATAEYRAPEIVTRRQTPRLPSPDVPGGMIWPPIEGRIILNEIAAQRIRPECSEEGDWGTTPLPNWRIHSYKEARFGDLGEARQRLIQWAHIHLSVNSVLSPRRCLVLTGAEEEGWRLWQVVRKHDSLGDQLLMALADGQPEKIADTLWNTARLLIDAAKLFAESPCAIPCDLKTISFCDERIWYNALMPGLDFSPAGSDVESLAEPGVHELIRNQLAPFLPSAFAARQEMLSQVNEHLRLRSNGSTRSQQLVSSLCDLLTPPTASVESYSV